MRRRQAVVRLGLISLAFSALLGGAFGLAYLVTHNETIQQALANLGYGGVFIAAVIAGLNALVPVPAASLTPAFSAAGLSLPLIITALVLGTLVADIIGYYFGHLSAPSIAVRYPKVYAHIHRLATARQPLIAIVVVGYASVIPLPNELLLIPLAIAGVPMVIIVPSLIIGNIIHQSSLAYGFNEIFTWLLL